jgi:hypothetical protein
MRDGPLIRDDVQSPDIPGIRRIIVGYGEQDIQ